jgi:hypothetical protein
MTGVFEKKSVSTKLAHRIVAAAEAKATEMGVPMGIAISVVPTGDRSVAGPEVRIHPSPYRPWLAGTGA